MNAATKRPASAWHIERPYGTRSMVALLLALLVLFGYTGQRVEMAACSR